MNKNEMSCYETDASRMVGEVGGVVCPESVESVVGCVRGNDNIVPRGGGSNLVGGCVPQGSCVIEMRKMNKVTEFDPNSKTVWVEGGVVIKELNEKLRAVGYEFPVYWNNISTIGGMIAMNCCGEMSFKYGVMKDSVGSLEIVNGRGELVKIGKADLGDVCGMEGTTGVIVRAKLNIVPLVKRSVSVFQSDNLDEILLLVKRLKLEGEIVMLKLLNPFVSKLLGFPEKYNLFIVFNSDRGKIRGRSFDNLMDSLGKDYFRLYSNGYYNSVDAGFYYDKIGTMISVLEELKIPFFSDLGLGVVFPFFKDDEDLKQSQVVDIIRKMGGRALRYGIGLKRRNRIESLDLKIIERVKMRHDPFNKFNKGKLIDFDEYNDGNGIKKEIVDKFSGVFDRSREEIDRAVGREGVKKLEDYERTFKSELDDDRRARVERFASRVSSEILKARDEVKIEIGDEVGKVEIDDNLDRESVELRGKVSESEKDIIDRVMGNKFEGSEDKKDGS